MTEDEEFEALEQRLNMKETKQPEALRRLADLESMHERGTIRRGHIDEMMSELRRLHALNQELLEALISIAKNSCCDRCQEAALVAKAALAKA